jgi:hypothetical protein
VRVWKVSLGLEKTKVGVQVIVHHVHPIVGERSLLTKSESRALCGNVTSARESWITIRLLGKGHREYE